MRCEKPYKYRHILVHRRSSHAIIRACWKALPPARTRSNLGFERRCWRQECIDLRARIEAREQRIRLLEEALRVLKANTTDRARAFERRRRAGGAFNEIEATLDITEAVGIEPEPKATPLRDEKISAGKPAVPSSPRTCRGSRSAMNLTLPSASATAAVYSPRSASMSVNSSTMCRPKFRCCATCASSMPAGLRAVREDGGYPRHILPKTNAPQGCLRSW